MQHPTNYIGIYIMMRRRIFIKQNIGIKAYSPALRAEAMAMYAVSVIGTHASRPRRTSLL